MNVGTEPDWFEHGRCRGPEGQGVDFTAPNERKLEDLAVEVCRSCPVKPECLVWGWTFENQLTPPGETVWRHDVYGATTPTDRDRFTEAVIEAEQPGEDGTAGEPVDLVAVARQWLNRGFGATSGRQPGR